MSLQTNLASLTQNIAADIKAIIASRGNLAALTTTEKGNLVAALNEVRALALAGGGAGAAIDDDVTAIDTTWSSSKIANEVTAAINALVDGAPTALDTLKEIADLLEDQENAVGGLVAAVGNRVRFDAAQSLTGPQQDQARTNIGAASAAAVGDTEVDLVAIYNAAKA
jgi:hypothetical protein